jgi:hypothetical protein
MSQFQMTQREQMCRVWTSRLQAVQSAGKEESILEEVVVEMVEYELVELGCDEDI